MDNSKLQEIVNKSGFPLQIGLEAMINNSQGELGWEVFSSEHSWREIGGSNFGFIDLVLLNEANTAFMIVECKKVVDCSWIFLIPVKPNMLLERRHVKAMVPTIKDHKFKGFAWEDVTADPQSPESSYCVVHGQDPKARPMLERIASILVDSTEAFAIEYDHYGVDRSNMLKLFFSVIVTTAELKICKFDPYEISIADGAMLKETEFIDVPYLRFRKQLSPYQVSGVEGGAKDFLIAKENTVFIVNANKLSDFLERFELSESAATKLNM
ncbi:MAG: hypothetical protein FVQ81_12130 [Candidatus Glassbacteria bacterium]|nr:hypothetical protein [Candidatus Glassbacteria bacterium]